MADSIQDPASLDNLHDIVVPGPVPWWPPAPGWYLLGALLLGTAIFVLVRAALQWRRNQYRREARELLARIEPASRSADGRAGAISELDQLLKRVALAAWPRATVASLTGQRWLTFLHQTGRGPAFEPESAQALVDVAYSLDKSEQLSAAQVADLFATAEEWISTHEALHCELDARPESD